MAEDEKEQTEFDEELNRQQALNTETAGNGIVPDEESTEEETVLEGVCPLSFEGNGVELFGILMKNFFLNLLTLGIYYPWAKAKQLRYYYGSSRIHGSDFQFHGTGREMFIGLTKALVVLAVLNFIYEGILAGILSESLLFLTVFLYLSIFFLLILIASVGARRYRMSRTSWRGIRFRFLGTFKDTVILVAKGWILTVMSLGFIIHFILTVFRTFGPQRPLSETSRSVMTGWAGKFPGFGSKACC